MEGLTLKEIFEEAKVYIKNLANDERSLKSISFSVSEEKKEFIVYFTWKKDNYDSFYADRDIFRENIKNYMKSVFFHLNLLKSNPSKYTFNFRVQNHDIKS